jgi:hypothetical protein
MQTKGKQIIVKSEMIMPNLRIKHEDIATFWIMLELSFACARTLKKCVKTAHFHPECNVKRYVNFYYHFRASSYTQETKAINSRHTKRPGKLEARRQTVKNKWESKRRHGFSTGQYERTQ